MASMMRTSSELASSALGPACSRTRGSTQSGCVWMASMTSQRGSSRPAGQPVIPVLAGRETAGPQIPKGGPRRREQGRAHSRQTGTLGRCVRLDAWAAAGGPEQAWSCCLEQGACRLAAMLQPASSTAGVAACVCTCAGSSSTPASLVAGARRASGALALCACATIGRMRSYRACQRSMAALSFS